MSVDVVDTPKKFGNKAADEVGATHKDGRSVKRTPILVLVLCACGGGSPVIGKWQIDSRLNDGTMTTIATTLVTLKTGADGNPEWQFTPNCAVPLISSGASAVVLKGAPTCDVVKTDILPLGLTGREGTAYVGSASFAVEGGDAVANSAGTHQFAAGESRLVASFSFTLNALSVSTGSSNFVGWRL